MCLSRVRQVEAARYYFVCGGENTVSDRSAGVKRDAGPWAAGVTLSVFSRFWGANRVDATGTVMRAHVHTLTENTQMHIQPPPHHSLLFHLSVSVWGNCWASGCAPRHYPERHWYQHNDHWPQKKQQNKPTPTHLSYPITTNPPMWPSLVNSSVHHPVAVAAICTPCALKVSPS